ncbi:hypothetical protein TNCV_2463191 [Trichonephila clavipes]|nr:hypothetical protein TNCV_2463191 [Trichonephila clavipes]
MKKYTFVSTSKYYQIWDEVLQEAYLPNKNTKVVLYKTPIHSAEDFAVLITAVAGEVRDTSGVFTDVLSSMRRDGGYHVIHGPSLGTNDFRLSKSSSGLLVGASNKHLCKC